MYGTLTAPVGIVMEGQLKRLAANKVEGWRSVCTYVCVGVYVCVCTQSSKVKFVSKLPPVSPSLVCSCVQSPLLLCSSAWVCVYPYGVDPRPPVSSKALLKCLPPKRQNCVSDLAAVLRGHPGCSLTHESSPVAGSSHSRHQGGYLAWG